MSEVEVKRWRLTLNKPAHPMCEIMEGFCLEGAKALFQRQPPK
jgi:hypothetical protein